MNPQPVSLADELRKRGPAQKLAEYLLTTSAPTWQYDYVIRLAKQLLDQHAVAEPQTPIDEPKNDERGYGCHNCGRQGLKKGQRVSFVYCNECVGVGIDRPAHAAEQPKLTADQVREISEASAELQHFAAQVTEVTPPLTVHLEAIQIAMERVVDKLNTLLTSPVAPPPPQKEKK